jgi:ParB family chromosome partitioning protein
MPSAAPAEVAAGANGATKRRRFTVDSLFTDHRPQAVGVVDLPTAKEIQLERIEPDPQQPRRTFDEAKLAELTASIRIEGVLQPIVVRYDDGRDTYVIVHGERRWRASREAGLAVIPAIVREVPEDRRLIQQLMENIVRDDLNAIDRAAALRALKIQLGDAPWERVAEAVGIRRSRLFQLLGTEKLPEAIQADIRAGLLSEKQSRALQGLLPAHQAALRDAIIEQELPAQEAMRLARELRVSDLPDDREAAAQALAAWRAAPPAEPASAFDEAGTLLAALTEAAGSRAARKALARNAKAAGVPPFDAERLQADVAAVARSLTRAREEELGLGSPARATLTALAEAILVTLRARA